MNYLKSVRMDDHSILMAVSAIIGALGIKEIWGLVSKKMDIGATKSERKFSVYAQNIEALTNKITELEAKIESGDIDGKAGQNLVNLYKIIVASSQWSASKLSSKRYGKAAELTIKGDKEQPLSISWQTE